MQIPKSIRIATLAATLFVTVVLFAVKVILPSVVEGSLVRVLEERGFQVEQFTLGRIGLASASVDPGGIRRGEHALRWSGMQVQYTPWKLFSSGADRLVVDRPEAFVDFEAFLVAPAARFDTVAPAEVHIPSSGEEGLVESEDEVESGTFEAVPQDPVTESATPGLASISAKGESLQSTMPSWTASPVFRLVNDIPLEQFLASDGFITMDFPGEKVLSGTWTGSFQKGDDLVIGEVSAEGEGFAVMASFSGMESINFLSSRASLRLEGSQFQDLVRESLVALSGEDFRWDCHFQGEARMELLSETVSGGQLALSGQGFIGTVQLALPGLKSEINVDSFHLAGSMRPGRSLLGAGLRFNPSTLGSLRLGAFGMAVKLDQTGLLTADSEEIRLISDGWSARAAFRGRGTLANAGRFPSGRMEWTFDDIEGPDFGIEPFSLLAELHGRTLKGRLSPVGLRRQGTIWIEETELNWNLDAFSGDGKFQWYGTSGALAGSVLLRAAVSPAEGSVSEMSVQLIEPGGGEALNFHYTDGESAAIAAAGRVPLPWLDVLSRWWGTPLPGRLSGEDPFVRINLAGKPPFLRGGIELNLSDILFTSDAGAVVEGIRLNPRFEVNVLPRTLEKQELHIKSIRMGKFILENLHAEWELPVLHRLVVHGARGELEMGSIHTGPFSFNPLNPEIRTEVILENLPAGQVMEWLNEKRFSMEGSLSGKLQVGWEHGSLLLGNGSFRMHEDQTNARFQIRDPEFIADFLDSMKSAPADLQDRFREALMEEGIRLHELEVKLQTPDREGQAILTIRLSGESKTDRLEIPIEGIIINNLIPEEDLAKLLGLLGSIRLMPSP